MNRFALSIALIATGLPSLATANPHQGFAFGQQPNPYALSAEIRGQLHAVRLQARETLIHCDEADDVYDEIRDLCRRLDLFDETLARASYSRKALSRLGRMAERVDDQACELQEEIEDALEDFRPRFHNAAFSPRYVPAQNLYGMQTVRLGRVTLTFGSSRPPVFLASHTLPGQSPFGQFHNNPFPNQVATPNPTGCALRRQAKQLRNLTLQLKLMLCN